jgi:multiple sugar transport system permease protein
VRSRWRLSLPLIGLLAPYLLGIAGLILAPAAITAALAFTEYDAISPPVWRGLRNFRYLFGDWFFLRAVRNTLVFVALAVPLRVAGMLALALLLNQRRRGVGAYRAAVYLPTVIPDVAYALIWLWMFNPVYGPLNHVLGAIGLPTPAWLRYGDTAMLAIVIMSLFQIGEGFVVLLAGLRNISSDYYQAAMVDGASRWQMFRHITLPLLAPWLLLLTSRDVILSSQNVFSASYLMTEGGPHYATLFVPLVIYEQAFDRFRFGLSSAMMLLVFLGIGLILILTYWAARSWGHSYE